MKLNDKPRHRLAGKPSQGRILFRKSSVILTGRRAHLFILYLNSGDDDQSC